MDIYVYILLIILIISILGSLNKKDNIILYYIIFFVLILFAGLRYDVGIDFFPYQKIFDRVTKEGGDQWLKEIGFSFLIQLIDFIGGNAQLMFLTCAILTNVFIFKFFKKISFNIFLSILIYFCISPFYLASFNGMRQSISIAIFAYSLSFIVDRQDKKYLVYNLLSATMHNSALFILPFYLFLRKKITFLKKVLLIVVIVSFSKMILIIIKYTPYFHYIESGKEYDTSSSLSNYIFLLIAVVVLFIEKKVVVFNKREELIKNVCFNLNFISLATIISALLQGEGLIYLLFMRFNNYFFISYTIIFPLILSRVPILRKNLVVNLFFILFLFFYFYNTIFLNGEKYHLVPYKYNLILNK